MATIIEQPMSALSNMQSVPVVPQRRRRQSVEIIDLDLDDDDNVIFQVNRQRTQPVVRPAQRRRLSSPEVISLVDSDEDDFQPVASGSGTRHASRNRLFSPPAPNSTHGSSTIPPVPRVPRHYAQYQSLPMRRRPPPFPSPPVTGVVRPIEQPFDFEADLARGPVAGPSHSNNTPAAPPPMRGAPPSHHLPVMGLGGAIISTNRARLARERAQARHDAQRSSRAPSALRQAGNAVRDAMRRIYTVNLGGDRYSGVLGMEGQDFEDNELRQLLMANTPADNAFMEFSDFIMNGPRGRRKPEEFPYKPSYTHPNPPENNFTFDFAPPAAPSPKPSMPSRLPSFPSTSLENPIIIDVDENVEISMTGSSTQTSEATTPLSPPATLNQVLVCARCLSPLVLNGGAAKGGAEEETRRRVWGLRCGHMIDGKCCGQLSRPNMPLASDVKGKGKASAMPGAFPEDDSLDLSDSYIIHTSSDNPIRSRLRSQNQTTASSSSELATRTTSGRLDPAQTKRKSKGKAKSKIEAQHEWTCPVASCGRVHVSVKIDGVWGPEKSSERGAVPLFV